MLTDGNDYDNLLRHSLEVSEYAARQTGRTTRTVKYMDSESHLIIKSHEYGTHIKRMLKDLNKYDAVDKNIHVVPLEPFSLDRISDAIRKIKAGRPHVEIIFDHHWILEYYKLSLKNAHSTLKFWKGGQ